MHNYEIDSDERNKVYFSAAFIGCLIAVLLAYLCDYNGIEIPFWLSVPSPFAIYVSLLKLFEHKLWTVSFFRLLFGIKTPVIHGKWTGSLQTKHDGFSQPHKCEIKITQTWRRIAVSLETEKSCSHSLVGSISLESGKGVVLTYHYMNEPKSNAPTTMNIHYGGCELVISRSQEILKGSYFSGRGRSEYGEIEVKKALNN